MKNKVIIILFIVLIFVILITTWIQDMNDPTYIFDWNILLIVIAMYITLFFILFIHNILVYKKYNQLIRGKAYNAVLRKAGKMIRFKLPFINMVDQLLCLNISIFSLINSDQKNFLQYIEKVRHKHLLAMKYFWLTYVKIKEMKIEDAKQNYQLFLKSSKILPRRSRFSYEFYQTLLSDIFNYYDDKNNNKQRLTTIYEEFSSYNIRERQKLTSVYDELMKSIMLRYYQEILN